MHAKPFCQFCIDFNMLTFRSWEIGAMTMMIRWLTALLLATSIGQSALAAENGRLVLWDEDIEHAFDQIALDNERCAHWARSARTNRYSAPALCAVSLRIVSRASLSAGS